MSMIVPHKGILIYVQLAFFIDVDTQHNYSLSRVMAKYSFINTVVLNGLHSVALQRLQFTGGATSPHTKIIRRYNY